MNDIARKPPTRPPTAMTITGGVVGLTVRSAAVRLDAHDVNMRGSTAVNASFQDNSFHDCSFKGAKLTGGCNITDMEIGGVNVAAALEYFAQRHTHGRGD